jgi:Plasmid pRiA4b ORF-3-like protein
MARAPSRAAEEPVALVLKITLLGLRPPVWRRVRVAGDSTLRTLHHVIQAVMGWHDSHLHEFEIGDRRYGEPDDEPWPGAERIHGETNLKLGALLGQRIKRFRYVYDFGDDWEHQIDVEKVEPLDPEQPYPSLITGKRACPPEDCGGIYGYLHLLEVLADPGHEEHAELSEWVDGPLDPEHFDIVAANKALARLARRRKQR